jgi:hypothetical protein
MKQITSIKHWQKSGKGEVTDRVEIKYKEGDAEVVLHGYEKASPEFYKLFSELSKPVCTIGEFSDHEVDRTTVTAVHISYKDGENEDSIGVIFTAKRKLIATPQPLTFNTPLKKTDHKDPGQKLSSETWGIIEALTAEAEEYIDGKRGDVKNPSLFDQEPDPATAVDPDTQIPTEEEFTSESAQRKP